MYDIYHYIKKKIFSVNRMIAASNSKEEIEFKETPIEVLLYI